jgi:hypothetical protein
LLYQIKYVKQFCSFLPIIEAAAPTLKEEQFVFQVTSEASDVVRKLIPSQLPTVRTATCQITTPEASPDPLELVQLLDPELDEESSTGSKSKYFVEQHFKKIQRLLLKNTHTCTYDQAMVCQC